jgi:hypothetical protein
VISADGRVVPGSVRLTRSGGRDFDEIIQGHLLSARLQPAQVGRCGVPLLAVQPFVFRLAR